MTRSLKVTGLLALLAVCNVDAYTNQTDVDLVARQSSSMYTYVNLGVNTGNPIHRASGLLYGVPRNAGQIPSTFYKGMGFNYLSDGGAQDPQYKGWIGGGYTGRFSGVATRYKAAKSYGARFMIKMSDVWGADATQGSNAIWPGDNGNWAEYDRFLTQFVSDIKANGMTDAEMQIWNEPDLSIFWAKSQAQYLQTWSRAAKFLRANLPGTKIAGPAMANQPDPNNGWWTAFLNEVKSAGTYPDIYTWHHESGAGNAYNDLSITQPNMVNMLNSHGLRIGEFVIDEYAVAAEQVPGGGAWWIASFERWNINGLRGNWAGGWALQDFFAGLLGKSDNNSPSATGYYGNGEYQVYRYYVEQMTGYRVQTTRSTDKKMDSYSVVNSGNRVVRTLVGGRQVTGTYQLEFQNLNALGLPASGSINVRTFEFAWSGVRGRLDAPKDLGTVAHSYSGNKLSFPIYQTSTTTTWAFEWSY